MNHYLALRAGSHLRGYSTGGFHEGTEDYPTSFCARSVLKLPPYRFTRELNWEDASLTFARGFFPSSRRLPYRASLCRGSTLGHGAWYILRFSSANSTKTLWILNGWIVAFSLLSIFSMPITRNESFDRQQLTNVSIEQICNCGHRIDLHVLGVCSVLMCTCMLNDRQ